MRLDFFPLDPEIDRKGCETSVTALASIFMHELVPSCSWQLGLELTQVSSVCVIMTEGFRGGVASPFRAVTLDAEGSGFCGRRRALRA